MGPTQVMNTLSLYDWAKMFDGFKLVVDEYFSGRYFVRAKKNTWNFVTFQVTGINFGDSNALDAYVCGVRA